MTVGGDHAAGAAVGALYARLGPALHRYARMILANGQDAEDAVQQVFVRLLTPGRTGGESTDAYLWAAVRNECLTTLRKRRRAPVSGDAPLLEPVTAGADPAERLALEQALLDLPPDQREVVHLKVFEGFTFDEIGALTADSPNTAASRWRYAMTKLRATLGTRQS